METLCEQCDQIWKNFARSFPIWQNAEPSLANF